MRKYEGQRDMLYNQTFNLDQVEFASEGIKDAKQTRPKGHDVSFEIGKQKVEKNDEDFADSRHSMKFKSLLVEAMMYLITVIDEEELMGEITSMLWKLTWAWRQKVMGCLHIFILIWKEELILPPAPTGHAAPAVPASRVNQGGIDENEDPRDVAIGELREETGITSAEVLAEVPYWLTNDFPPKVQEKLNRQWGSDWKGQAQKCGKDAEINLLGNGTEKAKFGAWSWMSPERVVDHAVDFKKPIYREVLTAFSPHLQ
ncbi:unnamed protein product [Camellia sinensis]